MGPIPFLCQTGHPHSFSNDTPFSASPFFVWAPSPAVSGTISSLCFSPGFFFVVDVVFSPFCHRAGSTPETCSFIACQPPKFFPSTFFLSGLPFFSCWFSFRVFARFFPPIDPFTPFFTPCRGLFPPVIRSPSKSF